jgi:hypothetical protein
LQQHFEKSKVAIEKENIREKLRTIVAKVMQQARNKDKVIKLLRNNKIGVIFRTNQSGCKSQFVAWLYIQHF